MQSMDRIKGDPSNTFPIYYIRLTYLFKLSTKGERGAQCQNICPHGLWMAPQSYTRKCRTKWSGWRKFEGIRLSLNFFLSPLFLSRSKVFLAKQLFTLKGVFEKVRISLYCFLKNRLNNTLYKTYWKNYFEKSIKSYLFYLLR